MFLSNPRKLLLLIGLLAIILQACGGSQSDQNNDFSSTGATVREFPFSTREPDVYQADIVLNDGVAETRYFVARKGERWRFDTFRGSERSMSEIRSDKFYKLDHRRKIYTADNIESGSASAIGGFAGAMSIYFRGKRYREFEDLGREGGLRKYKVKESADSKETVLIFIDEANGMMVRQEFLSEKGEGGQQPRFTYELRDLKLEVADEVFSIPGGYRKVTADEFTNTAPKTDN